MQNEDVCSGQEGADDRCVTNDDLYVGVASLTGGVSDGEVS